ncbi:hypothetical protein [Lysinibacillus sp. FJAT-14222]|uniref:hypothetical protein n=1 Tax=Lysinibacillus sp. FJAT-14222 TaxID=1932366 RepID=UPI0006AF14DA|nr:hypothetical protein [Lysinibacillus sp. FJAT-14222]KOS63834.1 hypothetical protein AN161_04370 [Lysinibacillus sp. FJAT-14222]
MGLVRVPKFLKLLFSLLLVFVFTFVAYNYVTNGETFNGVIFSIAVLVAFSFLIKETLTTAKKKSFLKKEVLLDNFIIERLKTSLSLSYLYLIIHLSIAIFANNDLVAFKDSVTFALFVSFNIFIVTQIFQALFYYSKE